MSCNCAALVRFPVVARVRSPLTAIPDHGSSPSIAHAGSIAASLAARAAIHWTCGPLSASCLSIRPLSNSAASRALRCRDCPRHAAIGSGPCHQALQIAPHRATAELAPSRRETGSLFRRDRHSIPWSGTSRSFIKRHDGPIPRQKRRSRYRSSRGRTAGRSVRVAARRPPATTVSPSGGSSTSRCGR